MLLHHFLNKKFGLDGIRRRRLKIATLNELNDPFEMLAMSLENRDLRSAFRATKDQMASQAGLLCFSRGWRNPVQWSHYGDHHRGLCLQFEVPDSLIRPVSYRTKRLAVDRQALEARGEAADQFMQRVISTKFSHWCYENEARVFVSLEDIDPETGLWFKDFGPDLVLSEVIVGALSNISRKEISDTLGDLSSSVSIRKTRLSFRRFAVVTQMNSELWV